MKAISIEEIQESLDTDDQWCLDEQDGFVMVARANTSSFAPSRKRAWLGLMICCNAYNVYNAS